MTDLLEDQSNVRITGWLALEKARSATLVRALQIDTLQKNDMKVQVGVRRRLYLIV